MVSRQETARQLLTPGEVMQLSPSEEIVMLSGIAPIKAKKLQYYNDRNFSARVLPAPRLGAVPYVDRPDQRSNDWGSFARRPDARLAKLAGEPDQENSDDVVAEGGLQQERAPDLDEQVLKRPEQQQLDLPTPGDDDPDASADKRAMDQARAQAPGKATFGINEGEDRGADLLPKF